MYASVGIARRERRADSLDLPLFLTLSRLVSVPLLIALAWRRAGGPFCCTLLAELGIDIADGILARRLLCAAPLARQRRLDGAIDAAVYATVPFCLVRLRPQVARAQAGPLFLLLGAHLLDLATGLAKFRRLPQYHTRSFRTSAGVLGLAIPSLFIWGDRAYPFEFALWIATAAHLENILITRSLPRWQASVPTLKHTRAISKGRGVRRSGGCHP